MASHSSILAWEIPWTEEPGGLQSMESQRVGHNKATKPPAEKFRHFCTSYKPTAAAATKSLQLCLTLCNPIDSSPPGFPIPGILQARTLEWVAISFSNA